MTRVSSRSCILLGTLALMLGPESSLAIAAPAAAGPYTLTISPVPTETRPMGPQGQ